MGDDLRITVDEIQERIANGENLLYLDVRNPQAWAASDEKLPGAIHMTLDEIPTRAQDLARTGAAIVAYCT